MFEITYSTASQFDQRVIGCPTLGIYVVDRIDAYTTLRSKLSHLLGEAHGCRRLGGGCCGGTPADTAAAGAGQAAHFLAARYALVPLRKRQSKTPGFHGRFQSR